MGFLTMQGECLGGRSFDILTTIVSQRSNCNNVIQWSKFHADGCGDGYTFFGVQLSADDYVNRRATDAKTHVLKIFAGWAEPVGAIIAAHPQQIL